MRVALAALALAVAFGAGWIVNDLTDSQTCHEPDRLGQSIRERAAAPALVCD